MQIPLQIIARNIPHSTELDAHIRDKVKKLEKLDAHIIGCRVTVEQVSKHPHQGRQYTVRIDLRIPGREIAVDRDHDEDAFVALRDAFDAAKRQLEGAVRKRREPVKNHRKTTGQNEMTAPESDEDSAPISATDDRIS